MTHGMSFTGFVAVAEMFLVVPQMTGRWDPGGGISRRDVLSLAAFAFCWSCKAQTPTRINAYSKFGNVTYL